MKCYAKDYCKGYGTPRCGERCDLWYKLNSIYSDSNMPMRYRYDIPLRPEQIDRPAFIKLRGFMENILSHVDMGDSLFIYSPTTGNGKTTWSCKIGNYYIRKSIAKSKCDDEVLYLNTSIFLEMLRGQFNEFDGEVASLKERALKCKLLILDDLGAEKPSDYVCERLYDLINHRYTNMKSTIYTSNLTPEEIGNRLGHRIESRVKSSIQIKLVGADRRVVEEE